jgi:hypothetical protein
MHRLGLTPSCTRSPSQESDQDVGEDDLGGGGVGAWLHVPAGAVHSDALLYEVRAPVAQKVEHSVFHRGGVDSYPTRSILSGQVMPSN